MTSYRQILPQLFGEPFLTDAGLETDLIFNRGITIPEFAAHTLLAAAETRKALLDYFRDFLRLAQQREVGFILDTPTWKAHRHWAAALDTTTADLRQANHAAVAMAAGLRAEFDVSVAPVVLNGVIGPCGDAYRPQSLLSTDQAQNYHAEQLGWLAETEVDMVTAMTFTHADEAIGFVRAARALDLPTVVSFTVEIDGALPTGQSLAEAINAVDQGAEQGAAYFMINCAHPSHIITALHDELWLRRVRGLRCNASRCSHEQLDQAEDLDDGNPRELGAENLALRLHMPWLNVFGGCCGTDLRHVTEIANAIGW